VTNLKWSFPHPSPAAMAPGPHFIPHLFESLPLFGRQHCLQALIGLFANLAHPRLRLPPRLYPLGARVIEYLLDLRSLLRSELQAIEYLMTKALTPEVGRPAESI
jgi:hypothetical protein